MTLKRALCEPLGVVGAPEEPLGPFLPPVVQINVDDSTGLQEGDVAEVILRVRIKQLIPAPLG